MYLFVFERVVPQNGGIIVRNDGTVVDCVKDERIARALIGGKKSHVMSDGVEIRFKKCHYIKLNSVF